MLQLYIVHTIQLYIQLPTSVNLFQLLIRHCDSVMITLSLMTPNNIIKTIPIIEGLYDEGRVALHRNLALWTFFRTNYPSHDI